MSSLHTTQTSQVEIRDRPVSWRFCRQDYGPTRVFYDELHEEIILVTGEFVCKSHRASSKLNKFNMRIANHHTLLKAKFSPNNQYIGLQIAPSELVCNIPSQNIQNTKEQYPCTTSPLFLETQTYNE